MGILKKKNLHRLFAIGLLGCSLALTGCGGSDGAAGPAGPAGADGINGTNGVDGQNAPVGDPSESCVICHGTDRVAAVADVHALTDEILVSGIGAVASGDNVVISFNIKVGGVNASDFTAMTGNDVAYQHGPNTDPAVSTPRYVRSSLTATTPTAQYSEVNLGNGNYTITVPKSGLSDTIITGAFAPTGGVNGNITYHVTLKSTSDTTKSAGLVVGYSYTSGLNTLARDIVSNNACINCHSNNIQITGHTGRGNHQGVGTCVACHLSRNETNLAPTYAIDGTTALGTVPGTGLLGYIHGIHNSHNMPARSDLSSTVTAGTYYRNNSLTSGFQVSYPTDMRNCKVCHDTDAGLNFVLAQPVSWKYCMSCHANWDGFTDTLVGGTASFHRSMTKNSNCAICHDGSIAPATIATFHDGLLTERAGLLKGGKDLAVVLGAPIVKTITGVTSTTAGVSSFTWTATQSGTAIDPCNIATTADGMVKFQGTVLLRGYATGNDWTNAGIGTTPGQPTSEVNVFTGTGVTTTCAANVATTVIATPQTPPTGATLGVVGLGGKPTVRSDLAGTTTLAVRGPSVTRQYTIATGALPTVPRRSIVSTAKCLKCHEGTLYQHGGSRIDAVEYCVICHNPASNEQWYRDQIGVSVSEAYDSKTGQTIDLRYMLHAIHSAGENAQAGVKIAFYRSNGVYVFGDHDTEANIPNWPGTGPQITYGSNPVGTFAGQVLTHNFHAVTYPQSLKNCEACHNPGTYGPPNAAMAVALTVNNAGAAPWTNQLDDVLVSPSTAACMSCHMSGNVEQNAGLLAHAYQNSWLPRVFATGRQYILDFLNGLL